MQAKTTTRCHLTSVRMAIIKKKKPTTTNVGKDMEKGEPSHTVGRNANWCSYCGKQYEGFSKVKIVLPCGPAISLLGINSGKKKTKTTN